MELEKRINEHFHLFNEVDEYIANCILQSKTKCEELTIQQFAQLIHVSQSALTRFAQKIKLKGYKEIKSMIRIERMSEKQINFDNKKMVIDNYHNVIRLMEQIDKQLFQEINKAEKILIFADGFAMSKVASECKRMFLPLHKKVYYVHGHDMMQQLATLASERDMVFIFSFEGENNSVVTLAKKLRIAKVKTLSITKMMANELAQYCDYNIYASALELPMYQQLQFASITPFFLLMELLIIQYQYEVEHNFI